MKFPRINRCGLVIDVMPCLLVQTALDLDTPVTGAQHLELVTPLVPTGDDIVKLVQSGKAPRVISSVMHLTDMRVGLLMLVGPHSVATMLCDLSTPSARRWLDDVVRQGHMSLALKSPSGQAHLPLRLEGPLTTFCVRSAVSRPAGTEELHSAFQHVLRQFEQGTWLRQVGIDPARHRNVRVSLVAGLAESVDREPRLARV